MFKRFLLIFLLPILTVASPLDNYLFPQKKFSGRNGPRTYAALVMIDNNIVFEKYDQSYSQERKYRIWSISKTLIAIMYGIAVKEQRVEISDSICRFKKFPNPEYCKIKVEHLLTWSSAIDWQELYETAAEATNSSVINMLYGPGRKDMAQFVYSHPLMGDFQPGKVWRYSSGDTVLASYLLQSIFSTNDLRAVIKEKLFDPLGIDHWACESDSTGTLVGASSFYLSPRGLLKIGQLLLNQGKWEDKELFPASYFRFMSTVPQSYRINRLEKLGAVIPGASLWLNDSQDVTNKKSWDRLPVDTLAALGHWGQFLLVVPSKKLIAIRLGDTRDESVQVEGFLSRVMSEFIP